MTLECTKPEVEALMALIDAGVKSLGIQSCVAAAIWQQKIQAAAKEPEVSDQRSEVSGIKETTS